VKLFQYKLVLLGESAVGKSSLVMRFAQDRFVDHQESTIGAAFVTRSITLDDGVIVKFEIWDTAGQERYHSLAPMYYRGAQAAIIVYDITRKDSYEKAKAWIIELKKQENEQLVIALVGNKKDLEAQREVLYDEVKKYVETTNVPLFYETSAKVNINVTDVFKSVAQKLPKDNKPLQDPAKITVSPTGEYKKKGLLWIKKYIFIRILRISVQT